MRICRVKEHLSIEEIRNRKDKSKNINEFQRWQVIYLMKEKRLKAEEVGDIVGVSKRTVHQWIYYYNKQGEDGIKFIGSGGRRREIMSWEKEEKLLISLTENASAGLIVIAREVKQKAEEIIGSKVSKDYPYDLLHRHGWRKVSPRGKHPKSNTKEQEEYKKNSRNWWQPL